MIQTPYIRVAVTLPVMQPYTYQIPDHLKNQCRPGMRVLVPFGRRRVTGYILSGQESCKGFTVKKIIDLLDEDPLFPASEIEFFKWIASYYIHPLGDVIKTALPSGLDQKDVAHIDVTQAGREQYKKGDLLPAEQQLISLILPKDSLTIRQIKRKMDHHGINSLIRRMEKKDFLMVRHVLSRDGVRIKTEKFISRVENPGTSVVMSKKRRQILAILKKETEISLSALKKQVPTAPTLIKPLAAAGIIEITHRKVFRDPLGEAVEPDTPPQLTGEQRKVVEQVQANSHKGFQPYLLSGVTGSGKTEVYMQLVQYALTSGKTALVLVPEIALISQTERRFRARFGDKIAVIHSSLTKGERLDQWRKILLKKVKIVIGVRSSVFAPLEDIGMIVVDEEHDGSYKQETGLRYHARDMAVVRAQQHNCPVVLGSATPSLQSYQNVVSHRFIELTLQKRINRQNLPEITLVDLKQYKDVQGADQIFTPVLVKSLRHCLEQGNQALIFLNRRGFANFPLCTSCGKSLSCRYCDITMTFYKGHNCYRCHLCGYETPVNISCPACGENKIKPLGFGTEKIESMLKTMFPDARVARMDQDITARKGAAIQILKNIRNRTVDIVVGTQMLAKGHDFPSITLVGVVCADLSLNLPDFRAGERTFQLMAQVAGRAGRGETKGKVIMQTFQPDHFIIQTAKTQDFNVFFQNEAPFRKALFYPPFTRMIQVKISGKDAKAVRTFARTVSGILQEIIDENEQMKQSIHIMGPIEAPIQKIAARYRWQILIKSLSSASANQLITTMISHPDAKPKKQIHMVVDVDPYSLM